MFTTPGIMSIGGALLLAGLAGACFQPDVSADYLADGAAAPTGLFEDAGTSSCGGPDPTPLSQLEISVRTSAFGGRYAPRNIGAIWIEDGGGEFIKTVAQWGQVRRRWLTRWMAASGGNTVDAVTGATLANHQVHDVIWDLTDLGGCEVPRASYRVLMETTDRNGTGASAAFDFTTDQPAVLTPADAPNFHQITLTLGGS